MEDPVNQPGKKKAAFAFWERQRKDSTASLANAPQSSAPSTSSTSPSTARRLDAIERGMTSSPSPQRLPPSQQQQQQQQAGTSSNNTLSGVQRLIQQYSQPSSASSAGASASGSAASLNRSLSGRRENALSPTSSRFVSSSGSAASALSDDTLRANGRADSQPSRTFTANAQPLAQAQSQSEPQIQSQQRTVAFDLVSPPSTGTSSASPSTDSTATPQPPSAVASTSQLEHLRHAHSTKHADAGKARQRRRLLQEQLRKRSTNRRSAGAVDMSDSPAFLDDGDDDDDDDDDDQDDHDGDYDVQGSAEAVEAATAAAATANLPRSPASAIPNEPHSRPMQANRQANLNSESDPRIISSSDVTPEAYHDAQTHLAAANPVKPTSANLELDASAQTEPRTRPPSVEDTRPWLEFSPLLPDSELLDSPDRAPPPSFALLHQTAQSDLTASASQSSLATDPNASASARPSPSRSTSASILSSDSPRSPTGLGFSTPPGYPSAASYLAIHSPTGGSRIHRTTKLPPPRPSPQAPLPPPPTLASSTASSSSQGAAAAEAAAGSTRSMRSSSFRGVAPVATVQRELGADVFGGQNSRSRSYSLAQEVASADQQRQHAVQYSAATSSGPHATVSSTRSDSAQSSTASTLAVPVIRQRSNSLQRRGEEGPEHAEAAATSRPARLSPPSSTPPVAVAASSRSGSSKSGTVGRPRGFTVGAVPGASSAARGSTPAATPVKSRPRSLLSNEIFPLDLAEPRYKSKTAREDDARKTYSMDIDRRVSSLTLNNATTSRTLGGSSTGRGGIVSTSIEERDGPSSSSSSGDRFVTESTDRRPSMGGRSRSGSSASLLQQVNSQPKSHASFVIAVVGHAHSGKSTVIKKGLRQFGLSKPHVLSEKVTSHSTVCVVDQEQRTIEVLEIDASVLLNGPSKRFAWPKFLPHIDAVILCYDAAEIASFRGMSELLENFSVANLSTVMLACKSEVHPKAVDPYYASDMACIYNVGLAECTVQSEEGKKRMRDCFSYLVKEVAKARSGRARRGPASTVPPASAAMGSQRSLSPGAPNPSSVLPSRTASSTSQASSQSSLPRAMLESSSTSGNATSASAQPGDHLCSPTSQHDPLRARGYSNASSSPSGASGRGGNASIDEPGSAPAAEHSSFGINNLDLNTDSSEGHPFGRSAANANADKRYGARKMSTATIASVASDVPSFHSDEDGVLHDSLQRAQMGLQNARSSGGYVSIEQLWDKLFHAAISRTDERFVTMFMVFYRGFATPMDLLQQMMARFDTLTAEDVADGLVHRFALIRLANMLSDWVLDYPGDLSDPTTHALLVRFHRQLLHNPDTVHTASQIQTAVDATAHAPDPDALWSKSVNSYQTRHKGIAGAQQAGVTGAEMEGAGALPASHSSGSAGGLMLSSENTSHDLDSNGPQGEDGSEEHERTGSESSLPLRPYELGAGGRSRSASDLTASSTDGTDAFYRDAKQSMATATLGGSGVSSVSGHTSGSSNSAGAAAGAGTGTGSSAGGGAVTSTSATSSSANLGFGGEAGMSSGRNLDQKSALRSFSNVLMEVDDEVIATELTRLEWEFFTAIQPRDLLRHILVPHDKRDGPVSRSISHFNYISNWVCSMILAQSKTKHRARMLEKFFNIASILRHDNNYGSLNSVLGGLSKTAVHRLKQTRELLKGKSVNKAYQSLVRLMSNERSSAAYRLALENSDGPTIPYVGVHLQDIISISDGNASKRVEDGYIHWRKFSLMDEAVMAVARCQQYDRYFKPNAPVERLIVDVPVMDDESLYERSLAVEPRGGGGGGTSAAGKIKDLKTFLSSQAHA